MTDQAAMEIQVRARRLLWHPCSDLLQVTKDRDELLRERGELLEIVRLIAASDGRPDGHGFGTWVLLTDRQWRSIQDAVKEVSHD